MTPQWFRNLFEAYRARKLSTELLVKVREMIQAEQGLTAAEAVELLRQALCVLANSGTPPIFDTRTLLASMAHRRS